MSNKDTKGQMVYSNQFVLSKYDFTYTETSKGDVTESITNYVNNLKNNINSVLDGFTDVHLKHINKDKNDWLARLNIKNWIPISTRYHFDIRDEPDYYDSRSIEPTLSINITYEEDDESYSARILAIKEKAKIDRQTRLDAEYKEYERLKKKFENDKKRNKKMDK